MNSLLLSEIQAVLEQEINPILQLHLGKCEVVSLSEGNLLTLRLSGGCVGCPSSLLTLYNGIVPILEGHFPGLQIEVAPND